MTQLGLAYESRLSIEHLGKNRAGECLSDGQDRSPDRIRPRRAGRASAREPSDLECTPLVDLVRYLHGKPPDTVLTSFKYAPGGAVSLVLPRAMRSQEMICTPAGTIQ